MYARRSRTLILGGDGSSPLRWGPRALLESTHLEIDYTLHEIRCMGDICIPYHYAVEDAQALRVIDTL